MPDTQEMIHGHEFTWRDGKVHVVRSGKKVLRPFDRVRNLQSGKHGTIKEIARPSSPEDKFLRVRWDGNEMLEAVAPVELR